MNLLDLWLWPLIAVIVLPGLLVYLGLHVVERGVIFVDLALAQVAALGMCVAIVFGAHDAGDPLAQLLALGFTLIGAALFSVTRHLDERVPQEAFIGIIYVVSAAAATVVLSRTAEGDEALKSLLLGNILLVSRADVLRTAAVFVVIAAVHFLLRRRLLAITFHQAEVVRQGVSVRRWDFLFYVTFGFVVTSFVRISGVYLLFCYLIVPAVCGALLATSIRNRLLVGWVVALASGVAGLLLSVGLVDLDLPTGPTVVCVFGLSLLVCVAIAKARGIRS